MNGLSLKQPWATLVALRLKRFETRGVRLNCVGQWIAIQASRGYGPKEREIRRSEPFTSELAKFGIVEATETHSEMPRGTIVALAKVEAIHRIAADGKPFVTDLERAFGDYRTGRYAYQLGDVLRPDDDRIFARGMLGLWRVHHAVEQKLLVSLQHLWPNLPDELTSDELRDMAIDRNRRRAADWERAEDAMAVYHGTGGRRVDTRAPIERLIDKAVGRG